MQRPSSDALMTRARRLFPAGVNSPVRAFGSVGGEAICLSHGQGAYVWDVDDNRYLDFVGSYGPLILGHAPPDVLTAVTLAASQGLTFGATSPNEVILGEIIAAAMPHLERMRFVSSGTEATMSALRLARGVTKRDKVIKFGGCYHGHADAFLAHETGSGLATLGLAASVGVTAGAVNDTITVTYNDLAAVQEVFCQYEDQIAAIIVEPIACNMGLVTPMPDFLSGLRQLCDAHGSLLIFDEVITGFRIAKGGALELFGVEPDLTTLGKIIGGGLPVGAYGGKAHLMAHVAPQGPVYQAGTLSGNPVAMAAGAATLMAVGVPGFYEALEAKAAFMQMGLQEVLMRHGMPARLSRVGSIFHLWCCKDQSFGPRNYADIKRTDAAFYARLFHALLPLGISLAPSAFEVGFINAAQSSQDLSWAIERFDEALKIV